jgi:ribosomal protein S26
MGSGSKNEEIRVCGQKWLFCVSAATFLKIIRIPSQDIDFSNNFIKKLSLKFFH